MNIIDRFKSDIEAFMTESGMNRTAFGKEALGDPRFVFDVESGRSPSAKTMQRVYDFMDQSKADAA
jgi:predicted transcriptional regulator